MIGKDLNSNCLSLSPLLSAEWLKIAVSTTPAAAMRSSLTAAATIVLIGNNNRVSEKEGLRVS
jgi:hypothetical protein